MKNFDLSFGEFSKFRKWNVSLDFWFRIPHCFQSLEERGQLDLLKGYLGLRVGYCQLFFTSQALGQLIKM